MKKNILLSVVLSILLLPATAQTWQVVGVRGFSPPVTQSTALTIDHNGVPYVAFPDASTSTNYLSVMKFNGSSWVYVGNADFSAGTAYDLSIAIDNNNLPWVAFGDAGNSSHTTVMKFNGSAWVNVDSAGFSAGVTNNCTLKFDASDTPYVAYVDNAYSERAVVQKFNGTNWVNVGTPGFTAGGAGQMTMAISRNNLPYIGYQDQANGYAESVMMYNGTSWVHVGAATFSAGTCQYTHITFDSSGTVPYVCYNTGSNPFAPNVQMFNGSSWQYVGGQNLNTDVDYLNNIAIDGNNTPYVIFPDGSYTSRATVMKYNGSTWVVAGNAGFSTGYAQFPNIAIDVYNNVYAEYYDQSDSNKVSVMKLGNFGPANVVAKFTASDTAICQNSSVTFTDQSVGSPTSWHWTFSGGMPPVSSSQSPTVNYDTPGIYPVKLVVSNAGGTDSLTKTSYIHVNPAAVLGAISATPDTICSGDSVKLSTAGSVGSLQWQLSASNGNFQNISGATDSSLVISPLTNSIYFRLIAVNGTCPDTSAGRLISVNPLPSPPLLTVSDSVICSSDSALIQSSGSYSSYVWNDGDTRSYTYADAAGGYWVTVTDANGCKAVSNHQNISVYPVPSVSVIVLGDTLSSFGEVSYQWLLNGDTIHNATGPVYVAVEQGSYSVEVTDTNGCTAISNAVTVTGISGLSKEDGISVYPNPSSLANIGLSVSSDLIGSDVEVYDDNGRIIFKSEIRNLKSSIPLNVAKGVYWLHISSTNVSIVKKLVKI